MIREAVQTRPVLTLKAMKHSPKHPTVKSDQIIIPSEIQGWQCLLPPLMKFHHRRTQKSQIKYRNNEEREIIMNLKGLIFRHSKILHRRRSHTLIDLAALS